jgi:hypothetical protein
MAFEISAADGFEGLTAGLTCTAEEFSAFYLQAQTDLPFEDRMEFNVLAFSAQTDADANLLAFRHAHNKGWFEKLMVTLIAENGLSDDYLRFLSENNESGSSMLQAITDMTRGFMIPEVSIKGMSDGIRWTGQVEVSGRGEGTGLLIGPNLFLTAWHVVRHLFNATVEGYAPDQTKHDRLTIVFDNRDTFSPDGKRQLLPAPVRIAAAEEWCVAFSPCHSAELAQRNPEDLNELRGRWDYAVIKLAVPLGLQRRYAKADPRSVVPRPNDPVTVFQYPNAVPLRFDQNRLVAGQINERGFIPELRFLHDVNTQPGSSGSPCFDRAFNCFGIHQGVWRMGTNKGIPLTAIIRDIEERYQELPVLRPEEYPIWTLTEAAPEPVVGCEGFQSLVYRSAFSAKPKLILINGPAGAGKTFRVKVLQKLLSEGAHLKIELNAESISKLDAVEFLRYLSGKLKVQFIEPVRFNEENSTPVVWLRDEIVPALMGILNMKRDGRLVWLLFTDINQYTFEGTYLQDLFYLICEQIKNEDWLRVVIDGGAPQLPQDLLTNVQLHNVTHVTEQELGAFFRYYLGYLNRRYNDETLRYVIEEAMHVYRNEMIRNTTGAVRALNIRLLEIMERLSRI